MDVRVANKNDLHRIVEIYNQAIAVGNATADTVVQSVEDRAAWFDEHDQNFPIYVMLDDGLVIGWCSISPYRRGRAALQTTAEISYYLDYNYQGQGMGKELLQYVIADCGRLGIENLFALLLEVNKKSMSLLESLDFVQWGLMPNVAVFGGERCSHLIYGREV